MSKQVKYIGMDVHKAMTVIAVLDSAGKMRAEATIETKTATMVQFLRGLEGVLHVTLEESPYSEWRYDVLSPHAAQVLVCDPRKNAAYIQSGNQSDQIDAHKLADLLRTNMLSAVYHGNGSGRALQELARGYRCLVEDAPRVMNRLQAICRGRGIACGGTRVYSAHPRGEWLAQLREAGVRRRAEWLYQQLDLLLPLRRQAQDALLAESRKHAVQKLLRTIPGIGPLRAALLIALLQTPHRFRSQRQLGAYAGWAVVTQDSAEYCRQDGRIQRSKKRALVRGLNRNHNPKLQEIWKGAAATVSARSAVWQEFYSKRLAQGRKPELALLTVARKMATIVLELWKKGERFDEQHLNAPAAGASAPGAPDPGLFPAGR